MEVTMKYRTQGSLPISPQHKNQYIPKIPEEPKAKEAPLPRSRTDEHQREQQSVPKIQAPSSPKPEPYRYRRPAHDPCNAIIETSPYYVYFKIVTTNNEKKTQEKDLKSVLNELVIVDKDMPRTAKYRHYRSYEQSKG